MTRLVLCCPLTCYISFNQTAAMVTIVIAFFCNILWNIGCTVSVVLTKKTVLEGSFVHVLTFGSTVDKRLACCLTAGDQYTPPLEQPKSGGIASSLPNRRRMDGWMATEKRTHELVQVSREQSGKVCLPNWNWKSESLLVGPKIRPAALSDPHWAEVSHDIQSPPTASFSHAMPLYYIRGQSMCVADLGGVPNAFQYWQ